MEKSWWYGVLFLVDLGLGKVGGKLVFYLYEFRYVVVYLSFLDYSSCDFLGVWVFVMVLFNSNMFVVDLEV